MKEFDIKNKIKRTKIISTIGPASETKEVLTKLFNAGMTTIRLNFSHGDHAEQGARIKVAREIQKETGKPLSVLLDTKGPEIRVGKIKSGKQLIKANEKITIYSKPSDYENKETTNGEITVSYDMSKDLKKGDTILLDDGKLQLIAESVKPGLIVATAFNEHLLKSNKRINLPGINFSLPFLSEKDRNDIIFGIENNIDYIAASFVNSTKDIADIKAILKAHNAEHIQILAKIESQLGVDNVESIIDACDGIMIARGDLGLEIPYYNVPFVEKNIIRSCRDKGKLVVVATQMLESMTENPHPTRAEVTDVYYATELGADATMLSGETAAGLYPEIVVSTMATINKRAEKEFYSKIYYDNYIKNRIKVNEKNERSKIAVSLAKKAQNGDYDFAIVYSKTGQLLKEVSKLRPNLNIIGVSADASLYSQFGVWHSISMAKTEEYEKLGKDINYAKTIAKKWGGKTGQKIFVVRNDSVKDLVI